MKSINTGRIFIDQPDLRWQFAASHCIDTGPGCYFKLFSSCRLPSNWKEEASEVEDPTDPSALHRRILIGPTPWLASLNITNPIFTKGSAFAKKSFDWWNAQLMRFSMRPNNFTLNHLLIPLSKSVFQHDSYPPSNMASIFIRRGDKAEGAEDRLYPTSQYFDTLQQFQHETGRKIVSVYISSDSQDAIDEAIRDYGSKYKMYFLPFTGRSRAGWTDKEEIRNDGLFMAKLVRLQIPSSPPFTLLLLSSSPSASSLPLSSPSLLSSPLPPLLPLYLPCSSSSYIFSSPQQGVITTADIFLLANSDVFIGTSGSNQCRLVNELRLASGNSCVKFLK